MRLAKTLCCLVALASMSVAGAEWADASTTNITVSASSSTQCTLPTYQNHTIHPVLTARLNKNRTVSFAGRTCPWAFIAVFQVHGGHLRENAENLVCDARPNSTGAFACTSANRYPNGSRFGVMIAGQYIVGITSPPKPRKRTGPETGFGGMARQVANHHPKR